MRKQTRKKFHYVQGWGTHSNQTLVVVGMTYDEISHLLKRSGFKKERLDAWLKCKEELSKPMAISGGSNGLLWQDEGASLLWLRDWKNDWLHWDLLVHELHHAVQLILAKHKRMGDEAEALAYQHEYLFREVRRRLWSAFS